MWDNEAERKVERKVEREVEMQEEKGGKREKNFAGEKKKLTKEKGKHAKEKWEETKQKQDRVRMFLEERPALLIGLASSRHVNSLTRGEALTLTEELLQRGYWVSSKVIWAQSFADALVRNFEVGLLFDTHDPLFEQPISGITTTMTKINELSIPLLNAFLVALQKQGLASPEHVIVPMDDDHDSFKLSELERSRLCLAALSMWGDIQEVIVQRPSMRSPPSLVDAMFAWPSQLPDFPDSHGISLDRLPDKARRGRDLYISFRDY